MRTKRISPEWLLSELGTDVIWDQRDIDKIRDRKEEFLPLLQTAIRMRSGHAKINAGLLLLELNEESGTRGLLECISNDDLRIQMHAMTVLAHLRYHSERGGLQVPLDKDAAFAVVEPFLKATTPRIRHLALEVLERLETGEASKRVCELINDADAKVRLSVARWLAFRGRDEGSIEVIDAFLREGTDRNALHFGTNALEDLAKKGDEQSKKRVCWIAMRFVRESLAKSDNETANLVWHCLDTVAAVAPQNERLFLIEVIESALLPWIRGHALKRLAELESVDGIRRLREMLRNPDLRVYAAEGLGKLARGSADPDTIEVLVAVLDEDIGSHVLTAVAEALIAVGGTKKKALEKIAERVDPATAMNLHWILKRLGPKDLAEALVTANAMAMPDESKLTEHEEQWRSGHRAVYVLIGMLIEQQRLYAADCKTGDVPADNSKLVQDLADITGGQFVPQQVEQMVEPDGNCKVAFVWNGAEHTFAAQNCGRYYDLRSVLDAMNQILVSSGREERFFQIRPVDGVTAFVLFAVKKKFHAAARKFAIPLENDPDATRRAGIAYTNHVLSNR